MNMTDVPGQNGFGFATIETPAGSPGVPVMVTGLLDAGLPDVQGSEEVRVQVTISPLTGKQT